MRWVRRGLNSYELEHMFTTMYFNYDLSTPSTEFNPVQQPLLNEKVLRDKRKKLRETFERIVRLYERENPDTYKELRKLELDYETKRGQLALYFDSVKVRLSGPFGRICMFFYVRMRGCCILENT